MAEAKKEAEKDAKLIETWNRQQSKRGVLRSRNKVEQIAREVIKKKQAK